MPKWNDEEWLVRNIPLNAKLLVSIYHKDDKKSVDDYIGQFEIVNMINYHAPPGGHAIIGSFGRHYGRFHLSTHATKSTNETQQLPRYTFDGPCRYSRHDSLAVDHLTMSNADCIYSTWKIQLRRISFFFPPDERQQSNRQYKAAQDVFGNYPISVAAQSTLKYNENGRLTSADDLWKLIFLDRETQKIKPRVYSYIIDDNTWQFSETGHRFVNHPARKHARLGNGSECIRYAGEFHLRPKFGWNRADDDWELVFDNASGTYSPNAHLLENLKKLLLFNFPGLYIITYDYKDPMLQESMEQLELAAKKYKYNTTTLSIVN
jgi:hypothetical protein